MSSTSKNQDRWVWLNERDSSRCRLSNIGKLRTKHKTITNKTLIRISWWRQKSKTHKALHNEMKTFQKPTWTSRRRTEQLLWLTLTTFRFTSFTRLMDTTKDRTLEKWVQELMKTKTNCRRARICQLMQPWRTKSSITDGKYDWMPSRQSRASSRPMIRVHKRRVALLTGGTRKAHLTLMVRSWSRWSRTRTSQPSMKVCCVYTPSSSAPKT